VQNAAAAGYPVLTEGQDGNHGSVQPQIPDRARSGQHRPGRDGHCKGTLRWEPGSAADVFVLDELTPPFETAHAALKASDTGLGAAFILDAKIAGCQSTSES
jgi:hypothetical protein